MTSNTKLDQDQKDVLKTWKNWAKTNNVQILNDGKTTIAFAEFGDNVQFSTAVCSNNEGKFRRKVGEYHALSRFMDGTVINLDKYNFQALIWEVLGIASYKVEY